jgi:hypothetical protein
MSRTFRRGKWRRKSLESVGLTIAPSVDCARIPPLQDHALAASSTQRGGGPTRRDAFRTLACSGSSASSISRRASPMSRRRFGSFSGTVEAVAGCPPAYAPAGPRARARIIAIVGGCLARNAWRAVAIAWPRERPDIGLIVATSHVPMDSWRSCPNHPSRDGSTDVAAAALSVASMAAPWAGRGHGRAIGRDHLPCFRSRWMVRCAASSASAI